MTRYIVELENNHHYILIDTVTGETFYTPAQDDANSLAKKLNNYEDKNLSEMYDMKCETCGYLYFDAIKTEYKCEYKKTIITNLQDKCEDWER